MKTCERCQSKFECGAKTPAQKCWCFDLPTLDIKTKFNDCLCPTCLTELTDQQKLDQSGNEDFYYNAEGLMVMTKAYHLKRGHCCHSGCLHCPYDKLK